MNTFNSWLTRVFKNTSGSDTETIDEQDKVDILGDDDLIKVCVRLSSFLREVDYHHHNVPIGISLATPDKTTCTIKWSLQQVTEPSKITEVARELNQILDELELTYAITIDDSNEYDKD